MVFQEDVEVYEQSQAGALANTSGGEEGVEYVVFDIKSRIPTPVSLT